MNNSYREKIKKINCLSNDLDRVYHKAALKFNVSDSVLCVLYMIHEKGDGCFLYDICSESGIAKQTINSAVRKLERENFIFLESGTKKKKRVFLTEKGKSILTKTAVPLFKAECNALKEWSEEKLNLYIQLTEEFIFHLNRQIENVEDL